jgi:hypothetical protein
MARRKIISVHTLVQNEARFVWYSVMSVFNHVDRLRIWDMGSTDNTRTIIGKILDLEGSPRKIFYEDALMGDFDEEYARQHMLDQTPEAMGIFENENFFPCTRGEMLEKTTADWFIVVDADEIWWEESIKKLVNLIQEKGDDLESIVVPAVLPVGDMFHRQEDRAGRYKLADKVGHYNLRAVNRHIPGLHSLGKHGVWGWADKDNKMIQDRDPKKIAFVDAPYLHVTHLPRASGGKDFDVVKRQRKLKHEMGLDFPRDFYYPEVFFKPRPEIVESPWKVMDTKFKLQSFIETPLRKIKRRIWWGRAGY